MLRDGINWGLWSIVSPVMLKECCLSQCEEVYIHTYTLGLKILTNDPHFRMLRKKYGLLAEILTKIPSLNLSLRLGPGQNCRDLLCYDASSLRRPFLFYLLGFSQ